MEEPRTGAEGGLPGPTLTILPASELPLTVILQRFTQQFLLLRLRHATTAQDEASEKVSSEFVIGSSPDGLASGKEVDDFVRDFREMRRVYHKRALFGDRWAKGDVGWRDD
jgi:ESCRT-I complex subunit VPS37